MSQYTYSYSGHIVTFTATIAGTYDITAFGAQGGNSTGGGGTGGDGAEIGGVFTLAAGEQLEILVGGEGGDGAGTTVSNGFTGGGGGGGGGSFVVEAFNGTASVSNMLVIAGGGGGAGAEANGSSTSTVTGGGTGGGATGGSIGGGGGGGYSGNGSSATVTGNGGGGGYSFANGGAGGTGGYAFGGYFTGGNGGFTGGGGGGGGGSFVVEAFNGTASVSNMLVIAGGGGGAGAEANGSSTSTVTGGGTGGGATGGSIGGGGGGGYSGNGSSATVTGNGGGGGYSFANGGAGGTGGYAFGGYFTGGNGGFGGGGGGGSSYSGGGGGGGYNGGAGGYTNNFGSGGAGGSKDTGTDQVVVVGENAGNGLVTITLICFLEGTLIGAGNREIAVEEIRAGDLVTVLEDGLPVLKPVKWVGQRSVRSADLPADDAHPVRIRAHAFAEDIPRRDLLITPEHCLLVEGKLIPARMLVNGSSISIDRGISTFTIYHIELEQHGVLLAENLPAESYLDTGNRGNFANADAVALRPHFTMDVTPKSWMADAGAPLAVDRSSVEPAWRILDERARALGFTSEAAPVTFTDDPALHLATEDGLEIWPTRHHAGRYLFMVPSGASGLRLRSRAGRPADIIGPFVDDRRRLGVKIGAVTLWYGRKKILCTAHFDSTVADGWFDTENDEPMRWTNGDASLSLMSNPRGSFMALLEINVAASGSYAEESNSSSANKCSVLAA